MGPFTSEKPILIMQCTSPSVPVQVKKPAITLEVLDCDIRPFPSQQPILIMQCMSPVMPTAVKKFASEACEGPPPKVKKPIITTMDAPESPVAIKRMPEDLLLMLLILPESQVGPRPTKTGVLMDLPEIPGRILPLRQPILISTETVDLGPLASNKPGLLPMMSVTLPDKIQKPLMR